MNKDAARHLSRLAGWLLAVNSPAAGLLSTRPDLLAGRLAEIKPGRIPPPPEPGGDPDEEMAVGDLRRWRAEALLSLTLALTTGRLGAHGLAGRLAESNAGLVRACLELADTSLRARYHHPLLPPGAPGPGPVVVLGGPWPAGAGTGFDTPHNLVLIFDRGQAGATPMDESDFRAALNGPRQFIIPRDYMLKLGVRLTAYLTIDHPQGPGLTLATPPGSPPGQVGPQISPFDRFVDFFTHQADDRGLMALTRSRTLAGDASLARRLMRTIRGVVLARPWTGERIAAARPAPATDETEGFDPVSASGGLIELSFALDGLLLAAGRLPSGDNRARLKTARETGMVDKGLFLELEEALAALTAADLVLSLVGRDLPGRPLMTPADLDAALALNPGPLGQDIPPLDEARDRVRRLAGAFR